MARKPLSTQVWESLSERISSGALAPGAQLPTEAALCDEYGVSRTVVREAVARLRSEGRVIPQQGRGIFVSEAPAQPGFTVIEEALQTLLETIAQMEQTGAAHEDPSRVQIHCDYAFHLRIVQASGNAFMLAFLDYLRPWIVPRYQLAHIVGEASRKACYARIHAEHERIVTAIEAGSGPAAREAMRAHLVNSLGRVRTLAASTGLAEDRLGTAEAAKALFAIRPQGLG